MKSDVLLDLGLAISLYARFNTQQRVEPGVDFT